MTSHTVDVKNLTVQFGTFKAVDNISFSVNPGEIFGFLGANGAGKTTTIRVLCRLLNPTSGTIQAPDKSKIGYMSQKLTLYQDLTVEENLNFIASLRKLEKKFYLNRQKELLEFIAFQQPLTAFVKDLSGGIKQQVALAAALLHNPQIIFLDEPTAGVSPVFREKFWSLIQKLAQQHKTIFVTTHYLDEAEHCERIALMRDGKIIALDSPEGLKKTCFPQAVYEFEPKLNLTFKTISEFSKDPIFSFFEPYGIRFHAEIRDTKLFEERRYDFEKQFYIRKINPFLEDVFIKFVEGS